MEAFDRNIAESARLYHQLTQEGRDFHAAYRIDPATGIAAKADLLTRIKACFGLSVSAADFNARVEVAQKILNQLLCSPSDIEQESLDLDAYTQQQTMIKLGKALIKGAMWGDQADRLRGLHSELDAKAYYLSKILDPPQTNFSLVKNATKAAYSLIFLIDNLSGDTPIDIRSVLANLSARLGFLTACKYSLSHEFLAVPTDAGMERIAGYYQTKYGIDITIQPVENLDGILQKLKEGPDFRPIGMIARRSPDERLSSDEIQTSHVTPLILNKHHGHLEVLTLDALGVGHAYHYGEIIKICARHRIIPFSTDAVSQADNHSCRMGSLMNLKEALIYLKSQTSESSSLRSFFTDIKNSVNNGVQIRVVEVPAAWSYRDQIFHKKENPRAVRDLLSSQQKKRNSPRTLEEIRASHKEEVEVLYKVRIKRSELEKSLRRGDFSTVEAFQEALEAHTHLFIEHPDTSVVDLCWKQIDTYNTNMVTTGHKFRQRFGA